ncbi:MAG: exosome complex RNA-binding protein Csl4 [Candidatus Helarchaeota archaeon]|nr:exosome complex RNA-binding protein Csl4 [Candidatus Helarchaeota archaeon]
MVESKNEIKVGDFVLPGQKIGVIEMYMPGPGTYEENGVIYATIPGSLHINQREKKVYIVPRQDKPSLPKTGDVVIGRISMVRKQMAIADITNIRGFHPTTDFEGMIHISQVTKGYLDSLSDAFKTGDLIRALITNDEVIPFHIHTSTPNLGVILATCSECGDVLKLEGHRLQCPTCRNIERRKVANDYGKYVF